MLYSHVYVCTHALQLYAKCTVTLESAYYNEKVAVWEPFIEPVEQKQAGTHRPWQVTIEVRSQDACLCL